MAAAWFSLLALGAIAQMDTLYFEDYVDNQGKWDTAPDAKYRYDVRDGRLWVASDYRWGTTSYTWIQHPLTQADSFIFEIKIIPETLRLGGAAYNFHIPKTLKNGRKPVCCYHAMVADRKGIYCFQYATTDSDRSPLWIHRSEDVDLTEQVYRIHLHDGQLDCWYNGEMISSYAYRPRKRGDPWQRWGFVSTGKARFSVDYILLMGQPQGQ